MIQLFMRAWACRDGTFPVTNKRCSKNKASFNSMFKYFSNNKHCGMRETLEVSWAKSMVNSTINNILVYDPYNF